MLRHISQICGEISVDQLTNRKHWYEISGIFVYAKNAINVIFEAGVTSYVSGVDRIEIVVQKRCFYRRI